MGAGQIGGIATLVDMDFKNAATFLGYPAQPTEAQYVVHYLSHAMMFCLGVVIEAHVVLTPASCVHGERYKFNVIGGTHEFLENTGISRLVDHLCVHRGYNSSQRWADCLTDNLALLVLTKQFSFNKREAGTGFLINRIRYGVLASKEDTLFKDTTCRYYGFGSRRNGYLIPLLIELHRMNVVVLPRSKCLAMFNYQEKFLCIQQSQCRSEKFGALCPLPYAYTEFQVYIDNYEEGGDVVDDIGSVIVCSGFAQGMMISRLVDRPCGVGFLDLSRYTKFLTCGVDDSRDVIDSDGDGRYFDFQSQKLSSVPMVHTLPPDNTTSEESAEAIKHKKNPDEPITEPPSHPYVA